MKYSPPACDDVLEHLRKQRLSLDDLINVGGEDLPGGDVARVHFKSSMISMSYEPITFRLGP